MIRDGRDKIAINHAGLHQDLQDAINSQKIPNLVIQTIMTFVTVYIAGLSVAGAHAWAWSALPATLAALGRLALKAMGGQSIHEDVVRELMAKNIIPTSPTGSPLAGMPDSARSGPRTAGPTENHP